MAQQVIAATVDHARLQHRVIESGVAHDLFSRPLRFVIWRTAVRPRAQKTRQYDLLNAGTFGGLDNILCSLNVDAFVSLIAKLAIDARTMCDYAATGKDTSQVVDVIETTDDKLCIIGSLVSSDANDFMSFANQSRRQIIADETCGPGNCDFHGITPSRSGSSVILL